MTFRNTALLALPLLLAPILIAGAAMPATVFAQAQAAETSAQPEQANFESDRQHILAMAGNYKVTFDFKETTPWQAGYSPIPAKLSGGHESVRVIEDTGRRIVLQHLLVVEHEGKPHVVKHWRQDWTYEPESVLTYAGQGQWQLESVPDALRKGRWSQTVWQTDDSPRYGGWGEWSVQGGVPRWRSNWTWRPLARRDAVRNPVYDRYRAINRHSPTPTGWIHWQDNLKMGLQNGQLAPIVQEIGLNSYDRASDYNIAAADAYWAKTAGYWAEVRKAWDSVILAKGGVTVAEVADSGSIGAEDLMTIADDLANGKLGQGEAARRSRVVIDRVTGD
jgi:hypothetical protein